MALETSDNLNIHRLNHETRELAVVNPRELVTNEDWYAIADFIEHEIKETIGPNTDKIMSQRAVLKMAGYAALLRPTEVESIFSETVHQELTTFIYQEPLVTETIIEAGFINPEWVNQVADPAKREEELLGLLKKATTFEAYLGTAAALNMINSRHQALTTNADWSWLANAWHTKRQQRNPIDDFFNLFALAKLSLVDQRRTQALVSSEELHELYQNFAKDRTEKNWFGYTHTGGLLTLLTADRIEFTSPGVKLYWEEPFKPQTPTAPETKHF